MSKPTATAGLAQLQAQLDKAELKGSWRELAEGFWEFQSEDGVLLNWRASGDELTLQGREGQVKLFRAKLQAAQRLDDHTLYEYYGDIVLLLEQVDATGIPGKWSMKPHLVWHYWTSDGAQLIWHEPSGRLSFKGKKSAARRLERKLYEILLLDEQL